MGSKRWFYKDILVAWAYSAENRIRTEMMPEHEKDSLKEIQDANLQSVRAFGGKEHVSK